MILDSRLTKEQQRVDFSHEVCHIYRHVGDQSDMHDDWKLYQEKQAKYFALHFCVPTFMLKKLKLPRDQYEASIGIADRFEVPVPFARYRLNIYHNKIMTAFYL